MHPWQTIASARTPDGTELVLACRGAEFVVRAAGHVLMSSRQHGSEEAMAEAVRVLLSRRLAPRILVGGLGLGYTLRASLNVAPPDAEVVVAELVPALVGWNRGPLAPLAGHPLDDARVRVALGDVTDLVARSSGAFDAVLLDVDNGPTALVSEGNDRLYGRRGLARLFDALRPGGAAVVWSAGPDASFERRAADVGFRVLLERPRAHGARGVRHALFVLERLAGA
jgi:spermidine synthase